jgi:hypothetical protein
MILHAAVALVVAGALELQPPHRTSFAKFSEDIRRGLPPGRAPRSADARRRRAAGPAGVEPALARPGNCRPRSNRERSAHGESWPLGCCARPPPDSRARRSARARPTPGAISEDPLRGGESRPGRRDERVTILHAGELRSRLHPEAPAAAESLMTEALELSCPRGRSQIGNVAGAQAACAHVLPREVV